MRRLAIGASAVLLAGMLPACTTTSSLPPDQQRVFVATELWDGWDVSDGDHKFAFSVQRRPDLTPIRPHVEASWPEVALSIIGPPDTSAGMTHDSTGVSILFFSRGSDKKNVAEVKWDRATQKLIVGSESIDTSKPNIKGTPPFSLSLEWDTGKNAFVWKK